MSQGCVYIHHLDCGNSFTGVYIYIFYIFRHKIVYCKYVEFLCQQLTKKSTIRTIPKVKLF